MNIETIELSLSQEKLKIWKITEQGLYRKF